MKIENKKNKTHLIQRLKRIEGQIRGIQVMLDKERDCREIMQQLTAVHSAVQSASRIFFQDYAAACLAKMNNQDEKTSQVTREQMVHEMIALLDKTP
jgi:CsoR family transcriptional regulator, copper-sensing transcriptional repressor